MKKCILTLASIALIALELCASGNQEGSAKAEPGVKTYKVGVSKLLAHKALDAAEKGMMDYLATTDLNINWDLENAQGEVSTSASIAQKFKDEKMDVVVGIATPTAQALANVFTDVPVVFSAVTDAVDAGLVSSDKGDSSSNVCGVSDKNPVESQIKLLVELTGAKTIGNIYTSSEANGVVLMEAAKKACENLGIGFITAAVPNSSEVKTATQSIIDRVDAIYIATDNTVISALPAVDDVCTKNGKALMSADPSGVDGLNCLVAWGFNYTSIGKATGKLVEQILKGANAGTLGTVYLTEPEEFELWFNLDTAKALGIKIDQKLLDSAAVIIENGVKTVK